MKEDIWVLTDHRPGTATQAIAVAEHIGEPYAIKKLRYNILGYLPNCIIGSTSIHIDKRNSSDLTSDLPKLLISAGRKTASVALSLKKRNKDIKIVQIMRPLLDHSHFDLIILPQHDKYESHDNVMRIVGSLHHAQDKIVNSTVAFNRAYPEMRNLIAVLVGGSNKKYSFSECDAFTLVNILSRVSDNHGMPLFISFSRRTPNKVKHIITSAFSSNKHVIYDPQNENTYNPYYGMLANANFIIATCDSVSMCSEAASSGKPLYIFCASNVGMSKHRYFAQMLIDLRVARSLSYDTNMLEEYYYNPFDEASKVAAYIKDNILKSSVQ